MRSASSHTLPQRRAPARAPWGWALTGALLAFCATALVFAPAPWLAHAVARASQGQVLLTDARGTVWNGQARLVFTGGAGSQDHSELPTPLSWALRPRWNGLEMRLHSDCCTTAPLQAQVRAYWGGAQVQVHDSNMHLPANLLHGLGTPWNTLGLRGQLQLHTEQLQLQLADGRWSGRGSAQLDALAVSSRLVPDLVLGNYRLQVQGNDGAAGQSDGVAQLRLTTLDGMLHLSGQGQWYGQRLHFRGEASARAGAEALLGNLLNIMGQRQGARSILSFG